MSIADYSRGDVILKPDGSKITRSSLMADAESFYESKYQNGLTDICDFSEGSEIRTLHESFLVEVFSLYKEMFRTAKMKFVLDSQGTYLDRLGCEYHLRRQRAKKASGSVTFTMTEALRGNYVIPQGTIILNRENGYEYILDENVTLTGVGTPTNGTVHAKLEGSRYNTSSNTLTTFQDIHTVRRNVKVTNNGAITGGKDPESDADFKVRILNAKREKSWGTVKEYNNFIKETVIGDNYNVHDVQFVDPNILKNDENLPAHYKPDTSWETILDKSFSVRQKHYCTDCVRVLFVNGNMKPCDEEVINEVDYIMTQQNNLVVGHLFHVQGAEPKPVYFSMELYTNSVVSETVIYAHLSAFFDGGTVETKMGRMAYEGVNINQTVRKNELLDVLENVPGIEQVGSLHILKYRTDLTDNNNWIDNADNTYTYTDDDGYTFTKGTRAEEVIDKWGWSNFTKIESSYGQVLTCGSKKDIDPESETIFDINLNIIEK